MPCHHLSSVNSSATMSESTSLFLTYSYSDLILTFLLWNYVLGCFWTFVHLCAFLLLKKAGEKEVASCGLHFSYWMVTAGDWKWYCPEGGYHSWIPMSLKGLSFDSALWSVMAVGHDFVSGLIVLWMYFYVQGCFFFFFWNVSEKSLEYHHLYKVILLSQIMPITKLPF